MLHVEPVFRTDLVGRFRQRQKEITMNCTNLISRPFAIACLAKHQDLIVGETAKTTYSGSHADPG